VEGAQGDANLRSFMNWADLEGGGVTSEVLAHWQKLGRFRKAHRAVGAGEHRRLQAEPYIFSRTLVTDSLVDRVIVAMDQGEGARVIPVFGVFPDSAELVDAYSGRTATVTNGVVSLPGGSALVLLSKRRPASGS
jgi:alpha-amylase